MTYVVPGVILLCAGFGAATTAVSVSQDMTGGIVDRFRSMDVGGAAVLAGHVAASVARNVASTLLVIGVAVALGFRPVADPLPWLALAGIRSRSSSPCHGWPPRSACSPDRPRQRTGSRSS